MRRAKISVLLQLLCVVFLVSTLVFSQSDTNSKTIYFRVSVTDKAERIVTDLKKENFRIRVGKTEQEISFFSDKKEPASVVILIDSSPSVESKVRQFSAKAAIKFVQTANNQNDYSVIGFAEKAYPLADWGSTDKEIVDALKKITNTKLKGAKTNFYDSCSFSLEKLEKAKYDKKMLLIFSDGIDSSSEKRFSDLSKQLKASNVLVVGISVTKEMRYIPVDVERGQFYLNKISSMTGGKSFYPQSQFEIDEIIERLILMFENQYVIGFESKETAKQNDWRSVEITAEHNGNSKGKKTLLNVYTREGYYLEKATQ